LAAWERGLTSTSLGDWVPTEKLVFEANTSIPPPASEDAKKTARFGFFDEFTLAARIDLDHGGGGTILSKMADVPQGEGYQLAIVEGRLQLNLVKRWLDDALRVETQDVLPSGTHSIAATYDGSRVADGVRLYVDGQPQKLKVLLDDLNQSFVTGEPVRIGAGGGPAMQFRGKIESVRIYADAMPAATVQVLAVPQSLAEILELPPGKRSDLQWFKLQTYFYEQAAPAALKAAYRQRNAARRELALFRERLPTVMVMQEMPTPRPAHILLRGQYDKPGEPVERNIPAELPPLPPDAPRNRLGLARWLVDPANPLTSRVFVNRAWQLHFGTGIVKTAEDFGRQGEWPSHPELLDWLAADFMRSGWDMKRLHRRIVESATYRQASAIADFGLRIADLDAGERKDSKSQIQNPKLTDPENRLLSRGPRQRLSAETVRDQALYASGLLVEQLGGPSVRPWQPAGLWSELTGGEDYQPGSGAELHRRSLYTFWKRTIPPPLMATFDASSREACVVRQSRTNTPLQALALLNEPTFVAAAQSLAERVIAEADTPEKRIARAMLYVVSRPPSKQELAVLLAALQRYQSRRISDNDEAAAYAVVCATILNLDEAVTSQ
jgi:hypothetical protein